MTQIRSHGPLKGLRVLDLTQFLSGPFATQILGDLGADVIKVEAPEGDLTRVLPPHFIRGDSVYYSSVNRNKRSVAIDLKTAAGLDLVRALALKSDAVIENFRPGVLEKLGLKREELQKAKPTLVWASISGFGQDGPYRDRPAYDMIVQAMSGGMSLTGEADGPAVRSGIPIGDLAAGMYAVIGLLAALFELKGADHGRAIDVSMLDCQIAMLCYQAAYCLQSGDAPGRQGRGHDSIPTYRSFRCGDGQDVVITANTERMWKALCHTIERADLIEDRRFVDNETRYRNRHALWEILEAAFASATAAEWAGRMIERQIPAAVVNTVRQSLADKQVLHRNMVVSIEDDAGHKVVVAGNPIKFLGDTTQTHNYPPALSQDEDEVMTEVLGLGEEAIANLRAAKVVGRRNS